MRIAQSSSLIQSGSEASLTVYSKLKYSQLTHPHTHWEPTLQLQGKPHKNQSHTASLLPRCIRQSLHLELIMYRAHAIPYHSVYEYFWDR